MLTERELHEELSANMAHWWAKLRRMYPERVGAMPTIKPNRRLKRTIAWAIIEENVIEYSVSIALRNVALFKSDIIPHELAHIVAPPKYVGDKHHNREWKQVMHDLGLAPSLSYEVM